MVGEEQDGERPPEVGPSSDEVTRAQLTNWLQNIGARQDRQSFEALFRYFSPRLLQYLLRTGSPIAAAEEFVQDTMTEIWLKAHQYQAERAAPSTWVFAIARNLRVDRSRKFPGKTSELMPETIDLASAGLDDDPQIEALQVLDCIEALPAEQTQILHLVYLDGLSHSEISRRLSLPLGTVKSRLRLAFDKLRKTLSLES